MHWIVLLRCGHTSFYWSCIHTAQRIAPQAVRLLGSDGIRKARMHRRPFRSLLGVSSTAGCTRSVIDSWQGIALGSAASWR